MRSALESLAVLGACVIVAGCNGASTELPSEGPWETIAERPCPDDSILTWENFGQPFMRDWCTGCHSEALPEGQRVEAPIDVNLDSHDGVMEWLDRAWIRAADDNRTMPPAGGPGAEERALLGEWLACGAPTRR